MILACPGSTIIFIPLVLAIGIGFIGLLCALAGGRSAAIALGVLSLLCGIWFLPIISAEPSAIPFVVPGPLMGGFSLAWGLFVLPKPRKRDPGFCQTCDYNLTGNVSGICPECGTPVPLVSDEMPIDDRPDLLTRPTRILPGLAVLTPAVIAALLSYTDFFTTGLVVTVVAAAALIWWVLQQPGRLADGPRDHEASRSRI